MGTRVKSIGHKQKPTAGEVRTRMLADQERQMASKLGTSARATEMRRTGLEAVGEVPWGTHLCQFYATTQDLTDVLVPYFKAGLRNNELCIWVASEPLGVEEAKAALRKEVRNLDYYINKGQIEILNASQWYTKSGGLELDRVLRGRGDKEREALKQGYDGLRATGNTFWLEFH